MVLDYYRWCNGASETPRTPTLWIFSAIFIVMKSSMLSFVGRAVGTLCLSSSEPSWMIFFLSLSLSQLFIAIFAASAYDKVVNRHGCMRILHPPLVRRIYLT